MITIEIFITVIVAILSAWGISEYIAYQKIAKLESSLTLSRQELSQVKNQVDILKTEEDKKSDELSLFIKEEIKEIRNIISNNEIKRNQDILEFTKALGNFNTTLGKLETSVKHLDKTMNEIKLTLK